MRRCAGLILLCSCLTLLGVGAPPVLAPPTPTPAPLLVTPPPVTAPGAASPTVVVFPFEVQGGMDAKVGIAMAQIMSQEMAATGGVTVLSVPQNVQRADYLSTARQLKADYYISGYATPVGNAAAVVEQLVTVDSGIIIFSQTAQVSTVDDVASQALVEREAILAHSGLGEQRNVAQSRNTPEPTSTNGAQIKVQGLSSIVDSVFGHHPKTGKGPTPPPVVKPARGIFVARVVGAGSNVSDADVSNATSLLFLALNHYYNAKTTAVLQSVAQAADAICGTDRDNTIAAGTLAHEPGSGRHAKMQDVFTLTIYTCFGAQLYQEVGKADTIAGAIASAVSAYATAHPDNS